MVEFDFNPFNPNKKALNWNKTLQEYLITPLPNYSINGVLSRTGLVSLNLALKMQPLVL